MKHALGGNVSLLVEKKVKHFTKVYIVIVLIILLIVHPQYSLEYITVFKNGACAPG